MITEESIEKAQDEIENSFKEYVNQYMIEIMKSIIDDKVTDTRIIHKDHDKIVADLAYNDIYDYMKRYATSVSANSKFVIKPIELDKLEEITTRVTNILMGE